MPACRHTEEVAPGNRTATTRSAFSEGRSAQLIHVGPYSSEGPTIQRLHAFIADEGCEPAGKHHEIYLNDPSRTAPEKLRTIIRQPVRQG